MVKLMLDFLKAMKLGEEVGNPLKWKKGQIKMTALAGLLWIGMPYLQIPPEYITEETIDLICDFIVGLVLLLNGLLVLVHSKKIGIGGTKDE